MDIQLMIDGFTDRLFNDIDPKETQEHHVFLQHILSANHEGLTLEEATILLSKLEQICIMITTFYITAKIYGVDLTDTAEKLKQSLLKNLARRALIESNLPDNMIN
jgi:small-conductance mechanosensitive channel